MKKKLISLVLVLVMCVGLSVPAFAEESASAEAGNATLDAGITVAGKNGEQLVLFHDGMSYKILAEDGTVETWAEDVLIESAVTPPVQGRILDSSTGWIYFQTDKYATRINWEVLNNFLNVADAFAELSAILGISVAAVGLLFSMNAQQVYRIDETYYWQLDPFEWRIDSRIYSDAAYTKLIESFTSYRRIN